jgi:hypothetical protein
MPGIAQLVSLISNDVVANLATLSPPVVLTDNGIVLGKVRRAENSIAPRIVFIPKSSKFGPRSVSSASNAYPQRAPGTRILGIVPTARGTGYGGGTTVSITGGGGSGAAATPIIVAGAVVGYSLTSAGQDTYTSPPTVTVSGTGTGATARAILDYTPEQRSQLLTRSIATELVTFIVHCWGVAQPPDPNGDFDATQVLYQQVIQSTHRLAAGRYEVGPLQWVDAQPGATQLDVYGHAVDFTLTLATPVLDTALTLAPVGTVGQATMQLQPADGSAPETAVVINPL